MNYSKPEIKITKFDIVEDIAGDFISVGNVNPPDSNDTDGDFGFDKDHVNNNRLNLGQ